MTRAIVIGAGSRARGSDETPSGPEISFTRIAVSIVEETASGTEVNSASLIGGTGSGTWSITQLTAPTGRTGLLRLRTTTGTPVVIETARAVVAADIGSWSWRVSYLGDGLTTAATRTFTGTVVERTSSIITFGTPDPVDGLPVAASTVLTTVTTSTAGTGTWSLVTGSWSKVELSPTTGKTVNLRTNAALSRPDVGPREVSVRYTGDGLSPAPTASTTVSIRSADKTRFWKAGLSDNGTYGGSTSNLETYDKAFGEDPEVMTIFSSTPKGFTWAQIASALGSTTSNLYGVLGWCYDNDVMPVISLPVCQYNDLLSESGWTSLSDWTKVNGGVYDTSIQLVGQRVRSIMGTKPVVFRVGHEPTHFPWRISKAQYEKIDGPAETISAWRRVITRLRAGYGTGGALSIGYCHTGTSWLGGRSQTGKGLGFLLNSPHNMTPLEIFDVFYPGNDYVDIISVDFYDSPNPMPTATNFHLVADRFSEFYDFAVAKSKKHGVDEWGLKRKLSPSNSPGAPLYTYPDGSTGRVAVEGCGDNPEFIESIYNMFLEMNSTVLVYESYFRMFEPGFTRAEVDTGQHNRETAIHALSGRTGSTAAGKSPFKGKSDGLTTTDKGELIGWDHPDATGNAYNKYKALWYPPET